MCLLCCFQYRKLLNINTFQQDKFFIVVPHPLVITLTKLPTLHALIKQYISPGFTWDV